MDNNFLDKIIDYNKSQYISKATKIREIVAPEVWINDPYYCGEDGKFLYPFGRNTLLRFFLVQMRRELMRLLLQAL